MILGEYRDAVERNTVSEDPLSSPVDGYYFRLTLQKSDSRGVVRKHLPTLNCQHCFIFGNVVATKFQTLKTKGLYTIV